MAVHWLGDEKNKVFATSNIKLKPCDSLESVNNQGMRHKTDALFDALLSLCRRAHEGGLLSREFLAKTLPRSDGDFEAWLRRPSEIRLPELVDTLVAAAGVVSQAPPGDFYDSMEEPNPTRPAGGEGMNLQPGVAAENAQLEAATAALWLASIFLRGSEATVEKKREFLSSVLERFFSDWLDTGS